MLHVTLISKRKAGKKLTLKQDDWSLFRNILKSIQSRMQDMVNMV